MNDKNFGCGNVRYVEKRYKSHEWCGKYVLSG